MLNSYEICSKYLCKFLVLIVWVSRAGWVSVWRFLTSLHAALRLILCNRILTYKQVTTSTLCALFLNLLLNWNFAFHLSKMPNKKSANIHYHCYSILSNYSAAKMFIISMTFWQYFYCSCNLTKLGISAAFHACFAQTFVKFQQQTAVSELRSLRAVCCRALGRSRRT